MSPLNFAIIGAGNIGCIHAEAIARIPGARLTVVCNRGSGAGMDLAKPHGAEWIPHYQDAVRHPEVDVVSICTPSGTHAEIAETAAAAGKHLLVEKPLDITLSRVDRILSAASHANVTLASVFPLRFMKGVHQAKQALDAGRLGRLTMADAHVKWFRPPSYYEVGWRGTWELDGGGALMNQSIHSIDLLQWLAGPVDCVFARTATLSHDIRTEDTAVALLGFAHGGIGSDSRRHELLAGRCGADRAAGGPRDDRAGGGADCHVAVGRRRRRRGSGHAVPGGGYRKRLAGSHGHRLREPSPSDSGSHRGHTR